MAPSELEGMLVSHPSVVDAAVIGIPDPIAGEKPMAFVVVKTGSSVTALDIQDYITGRFSFVRHYYHIVLHTSMNFSKGNNMKDCIAL